MPLGTQDRNATITQYLYEKEDNTKRNRAVWHFLDKWGRIEYNCGGRNFEWRIMMNEQAARAYSSSSSPVYSMIDRHITAALNYKCYHLGEKLDKVVLDLNKGKEAIVNLFELGIQRFGTDFMNTTSQHFFNDGGGASTSNFFDGVETFLANTSTTGAGGKTKDPLDTYAGLSTALGAQGGAWDGPAGASTDDWPNGNTSQGPAFDCISPIIVDSTAATAWGTSPVPSWDNYAEAQLRFAINRAKKYRPSIYEQTGDTKAVGSTKGMCIMPVEMKETFQNFFSGSQRTMMEAEPKDVSVGFQVLNFDGWMVVDDFDVPANTVYGFLWEAIKYRSVYKKLTQPLVDAAGQERGFNWLPDGSGVNIGGFMHGNFQCNPRGFFKIKNLT